MNTYIITLSKQFPAGHNRVGEPTYFKEQMQNAVLAAAGLSACDCCHFATRNCDTCGHKVENFRKKLFDNRSLTHFNTVKQANGQPLNDKRNGWATLKKWDKQNDSLRRLQDEIKKTEAAIKRERRRILDVETAKESLPPEILALVESGALIQWRKYPNMFFVPGVDKARIIWDVKKRIVAHKFAGTLTDREHRKRFADVYNPLFEIFNKTK